MSVKNFLERSNLARFPFAFVVTYGRSGSTLLQGILNSIPGYCIRGENYSTLFYLFIAAQNVEEAHRRFGGQTLGSKSAWFGADLLDPGAFSQSLADIFLDKCLQPSKRTRCVGFKEIRFLQSEIPDELFPEYLNFLQTAFPGAALIFNVRDVAHTADSGWWQHRDLATVKQQLNHALKRFESYAAERANCLVFSYDALMADPSYCKTLFDFLGEPFDEGALEKLLSERHGFALPRRDRSKASAHERPTWPGKSLSVEAALIANLRKSLETQSVRVTDLRKAVQDRDEKLLDLKVQLAGMQESTSWRLTAPLRQLSWLKLWPRLKGKSVEE